ncbi:MAG TPA: hypothetical protein VFQ80_06820, partial [Thermomicrobiales bacterium]|nr:hypothetical protein [Thermomicrobiales bacterium]
MSAPTQEIILSDVLAWEPRLAWLGQPPGWRDREVSWASAARASAPMLAPLRGGEIVLLPPPAVTWSGASLATLLRDLAPLRPAAVVIAPPRESAFAAAGDLPLLTLPGVDPTAELESALNRLL